jgi:uracil-DNA glycosylase
MSSKQKRLDVLNSEVTRCQSCRLGENRIQTVFGEGNPDAKVVLIGEGPGQTEDETGRPFVGRAGKLLDNMIASMGLKREDVYIANIVKCRPPGNRKPRQDEMDICMPYLTVQLGIIQPKVIVALGNTALAGLTGKEGGIAKRCGEWEKLGEWNLMPCYHPSALLRNPNWKEPAWNALQNVVKELL